MFLLPHNTAAGFAPTTSAMPLPTRQRTVPLSVVLEEEEDGSSGTMKSMSSSSHTSNTTSTSSSSNSLSNQSRNALRRRPLRLGLVRPSLQQPLVTTTTTITTTTRRNFATAMSLSGQSNTAQQLHLQQEHQNRNGGGDKPNIPLRNMPTQHLVSSILEETCCGGSVASNGTSNSNGNTPSTAALFSPKTVVNVYYNPPPKVMYVKNDVVVGKSCKTMMTTTSSSDDVSDDRNEDEAVVGAIDDAAAVAYRYDDVVWELEAAERQYPKNARMQPPMRRRDTEDAPVMPPPQPSSCSVGSAPETNQAASPFHVSNHNGGTGGTSGTSAALPMDQSVLNFLSQADEAYQRLLRTRDGRISLLQSHGRHMAALQEEYENERVVEDGDDGVAADVRLDTFQTFKSSRRLLATEDKELTKQNGIVDRADDSGNATEAADAANAQQMFRGVPQDIMRPQWFDISTLTMDATLTMGYETVEL